MPLLLLYENLVLGVFEASSGSRRKKNEFCHESGRALFKELRFCPSLICLPSVAAKVSAPVESGGRSNGAHSDGTT